MRGKKSRSKTRSKSKTKSSAKSKSRAKSKAKSKTRSRSKSKAISRSRSRARIASRPRSRTARVAAAPLEAAGAIAQITGIAAASAIAGRNWPGRGVAPAGYIKGMALVYARVHCKLKAEDAAVVEMAKANTGNTDRDVLAWYSAEFAAAGMNNSVSGPTTLRHLFALLIGLGMRESSGGHCEGRDRSTDNVTAETAEAGLFQTSFNARSASTLLPTLFRHYSDNPSGFVDTFRQGVRCRPRDLENFGTGDGAKFQALSKECPAFAAEFAAVTLRNMRKHYGPINRREAEVHRDCNAMLLQVQNAVDATPALCSELQ